MFKSDIFAPGLIGAVLLLLATFSLPYGFYIFLRWIILAIATYISIIIWEKHKKLRWATVCMAILFNPFIPIYLTKSIWSPVDLICAGVLAFIVVYYSKMEKAAQRSHFTQKDGE